MRRTVYRDRFIATWGGWDEARYRRHFASCWLRGGIELILLAGTRFGILLVESRDGDLGRIEPQIRPSRQAMGWGTHVVRGLQERAVRESRRVVLGTGLHNFGAQRLHMRLGFREKSRSETHVPFEWQASDAPPFT